MKTNPLYMTDPYLKSMDATVLELIPEGDITRIILDQTVFYPMGGGQPTDQGKLHLDGAIVDVYQVLMKEGEINHYVMNAPTIEPGKKIKGEINWDRRFKHMRIHSAAHVIDFALHVMGFVPITLKPMKGDHGKSPFIVYEGNPGKDILNELERKCEEMIKNDMKFSWGFIPLDELEKEAIYLQPNLPKNKPMRTLRLEGVGSVADGGTIVSTTSQVGPIKIALEQKGPEFIVKYQLL